MGWLSEQRFRVAESGRWLDFAAYVTWFALVVLAGMSAWLDTGLAPWRRIAGPCAVTLTILLGYRQLRHRGDCGPRERVGILALETAGALFALWALREQALAVLLIIIASGVSESGDRRAIIGWLAVTNLALLFLLGTLFQPLQVMISWPLYFGFQLFSVAMSNAVASERHVREQLAGVNAELLATRKLLQESARNEERLRISRELHDVAGHRLTALKLNLRAELTQQREDQERIALCHDLSDELLGDIRSVVHQLRATDEIDVPGALTLLKNQHPGVEIHLDVAPGLRIDGVEVAEAIVRSTQEAITNALKHGRAKQVWITLVQDTQEISLSVRDDGEGGEPNSGGVGLEGMGERARALGGRLQVEPSQASGWTLRLFFPTEAAL